MGPMATIEIHATTRKLLARALSQGRLAHAFLLAGPEGAGKKTLARDFARALLCERRTFPGCGECGACHRVEAGSHPDLHWVEPEGRNVKISAIRDLTSSLSLHSYEGGARVGVVAEAERMTVEAQNAFLKTLEEPPSDTVLLLTTNNINRLLPTTQSRCQVLRVGPMPRQALTQILTRERSLDPDQARLVAALARGNARRALDFDLGFVVAFRQKMMTRLVALDRADRVAMIAFAEELAKSGHPLESVFDLLLEFYRDTLLCALGIGEINNPDLENLVREEARRNPPDAIIKKMETIHQARLRANGNANPRLNLEILTMSLRGVDGAEITAT